MQEFLRRWRCQILWRRSNYQIACEVRPSLLLAKPGHAWVTLVLPDLLPSSHCANDIMHAQARSSSCLLKHPWHLASARHGTCARILTEQLLSGRRTLHAVF